MDNLGLGEIMPPKNKKKPKDLDGEIKALKANEASIKSDLVSKTAEAQRLVDSETINLLNDLKGQVASTGFAITETASEVVFKIAFKRTEIVSRPDANKALANIRGYSDAAGLDAFKGEK